jgi:hypothetical protein
MWSRYRHWKHVVGGPVVLFAYLLTRYADAHKDAQGMLPIVGYVGLAIGVAFAFAYVVEEIIWSVRGRGRPCPECGQFVKLRSFRVTMFCPHCGRSLD